MTRTQDEILSRMANVGHDDFFGFAREVLLDALDFEHAKPYLKDEVTADEWNEARSADTPLSQKAANYLVFAIRKIQDHRGISATRSVDKLTQFAWLLGRDDVVAAMDSADYRNYGAPKVKAFANGLGLPWPDDADLANMAAGKPCDDDCESGCAS